MCLSHHRRPKLCGSSWGLHHFYSCFCQKMDFRAFFVYFHTFSYNFKVQTNFHRNWEACGLTEVSVKIGRTLQSFLTEQFLLMIQMIHCQEENKAGSVFGIFLASHKIIFLSPCRVSPFPAWGDFHARSRFARSSISEEKWGTTGSLPSSTVQEVLGIFFGFDFYTP